MLVCLADLQWSIRASFAQGTKESDHFPSFYCNEWSCLEDNVLLVSYKANQEWDTRFPVSWSFPRLLCICLFYTYIHMYIYIYTHTHSMYVCTYVYMYLYPFCLNVLRECMYVHRVCLHCSWRSKRISGSLELEFQMVVDPYVGAGKGTWVFLTSTLNLWAIFSPTPVFRLLSSFETRCQGGRIKVQGISVLNFIMKRMKTCQL